MSDCGCGGGKISRATSSYEQRRELERRGLAGARAGGSGGASPPAPAPPAPAAPGAGEPAADATTGPYGPGPITRLHAVDGLFLRATHLNGMQDYALALSRAVGIGLGRGVAYGYQVSLTGNELRASAGLAFTDTGDPLQTDDTLTFSLAGLPARGQHGYWLIVLEGGDQQVDYEKAYGSVCADPCDGSTTIRPWQQSVVRLRLVARTLPGLDDEVPRRRRSLLASRYFDEERCAALPWLVPDATDRAVDRLLAHPWTEGGTVPGPLAGQVPIGVLLQGDDGDQVGPFVVDQWTARRELAGPPGEVRWAGHLAMRPWSVLLAQVLQFADQLRDSRLSVPPVVKQAVDNPWAAVWEEFQAHNRIASKLGRTELARLQRGFAEAGAPFVAVGDPTPLPDVFVELPPAGYLGPVADGAEGEDTIRRMFGDAVSLHFCQVRADAVAGAVQAAQHLDRIPLDGLGKATPEVDILVPSVRADLPTTVARSYGWVAFVRSTVRHCDVEEAPQPTETVVVWRTADPLDAVQATLAQGARPDDLRRLDDVSYPVGSADWPAGRPRPPDLAGLTVTDVLGVVPAQAAADLAGSRAKSAIGAWGDGGSADAVVSTSFPSPVLLVLVKGDVDPDHQ